MVLVVVYPEVVLRAGSDNHKASQERDKSKFPISNSQWKGRVGQAG